MKKKMIPLIAAAVIFTAGCIGAIAGVQLKSGAEIDYPELDMFSISDDNVGKTFSFSTYTDVMHSADTEKGKLYLMWVYSSPDADSELMVIGCDVKKSASADFQYAESTGSYAEKPMQFCGTVRKSNDNITEKLTASITWYYDYLKQIYGDTEGIINEEAFSESYENISPYYIDVKGAADGNIFIVAGCAAMVLSAAAVLVIFFGKKVFIVLAALVLISVAVLFVSVLGKLRTMASIT